jgi:hypothetical protein
MPCRCPLSGIHERYRIRLDLSASAGPIGLVRAKTASRPVSWATAVGSGRRRIPPQVGSRRPTPATAGCGTSPLTAKSHDHPATHRSPKVHVPLVLNPRPTDALRLLGGCLCLGQPEEQLSAAAGAPLRERDGCLSDSTTSRRPKVETRVLTKHHHKQNYSRKSL